MELYFLLSLVLLPFVFHPDPAPGLFRSNTRSRNIECEWVGPETGHQRYPGVISAGRPRGDYFQRDVVICQERVLRSGLRAPRDQAILDTLQDRATALASAAGAEYPDLAGRTWLVEAFYPSSQVAAKLSFATKGALVAEGLRVSDRTPVLGVGDVDVITRMAPQDAYPAACQRYSTTGGLGANDALLAVVLRDPRETILHAGVCVDGQWRWLR